jgi:hypothetical protein
MLSQLKGKPLKIVRKLSCILKQNLVSPQDATAVLVVGIPNVL